MPTTAHAPPRDGIVTLFDPLFGGELTERRVKGLGPIDYNSGCPDFQVELFPLHSPLLGESLLVSFPPLSYMLKFSGSSYLISGHRCRGGVAASACALLQPGGSISLPEADH